MIAPRWRKVLRDLTRNLARTLLVVFSIAVGVAALGTIAATYVIVTRDLPAGYTRTNPASARIYTDAFDDELVRVVRNLAGVGDVEGRRTLLARARARDLPSTAGSDAGQSAWRDIEIYAISNFRAIRINQVWPEDGQWPPGEREILLERSALSQLGVKIGDVVVVQTPDDLVRELRVAGTAHDLTQAPPVLAGSTYGYLTYDTIEWLGLPRSYNELQFVVAADRLDRDHILAVSAEVREKIERSGRTVYWTLIPDPGKHPAEQYLTPLALLLTVLGLMALLLSGFLVVNTISAMLAQQTRQIGVMKAVGARTRQILGLYLGMILMLGFLALAVALPLGLIGARGATGLIAGMLNFNVDRFIVPPWVYAVQATAALATPVLAAWMPVRAGTRVTVREAITSYGLGQQLRLGLIDRALAAIHGLSRPLALSLRNTFRRKARLVLTLATLGLASAIFVSVFSVRASLLTTLDDALKYWQYDVGVIFTRSYRADVIERVALTVPGVVKAESWGYDGVRRRRPDDTESDTISLVAPMAETELLAPEVVQGRWLLAEDESALVVNTDLLRTEPDIRVGGSVTMMLGGRETEWTVVGVVGGAMQGPAVYANYPYYTRVARNVDRAGSVQVVTDDPSPAAQEATAKVLERAYESNGLRVTATQTTSQLRGVAVTQFNVIVAFLAAMAFLLAIVGSFGLAGTMGINVLERTREIGVMRAVGATGRAIRQIVIVEGIVIALLSWLLGALLAVPVGQVLSSAVGVSFLQVPLSYTYSIGGALTWLAAMVLLATFASLLPARRAARLSVREVLAYE